MNAIFFGNSTEELFGKVYSAAARQEILADATLLPTILSMQNADEYKDDMRRADVIFTTWGMPFISKSYIGDYFPSLKALFYAAGSVQGFARPFLDEGVRVFSAWAANAVPVAEFTVAQIILANKGYFHHLKSIRQIDSFNGNFDECTGIIGAGMIGKMIIERLRAYHLRIFAYDAFLSEKEIRDLGATKCSLEELFSTCMTVSNHLADNESTKGMLDYRLFSKMRPSGVFINTGRGAQVVEEDLVRALQECPGRLALLDVTDPEPPVSGHPFYTMPNVIRTPHIAGSIGNEVSRMGQCMAQEFRSFVAQQPLRYEITQTMLETMA